jgi:hypothetical protein
VKSKPASTFFRMMQSRSAGLVQGTSARHSGALKAAANSHHVSKRRVAVHAAQMPPEMQEQMKKAMQVGG